MGVPGVPYPPVVRIEGQPILDDRLERLLKLGYQLAEELDALESRSKYRALLSERYTTQLVVDARQEAKDAYTILCNRLDDLETNIKVIQYELWNARQNAWVHFWCSAWSWFRYLFVRSKDA